VLIRRATGDLAVAGTSPLHYACSRFGTEYLPIVALLLRCGASTSTVDTSGSTPCDVASNPVTSAMVCAHSYRLSGSISASSSAHNSAFRGRRDASSSGGTTASAQHNSSSHSNYSGGAAAAAAGAQQQQQLAIGAYRTAKEVNWSLQAATCHWDGCGSYELWRYIVRCAAAARCAANTAALAAKDSAEQGSKRLSKHSRELLIMQSERLSGARAHCEELSNSNSASAATSSMARHFSTSTRDSVSSVLTSATGNSSASAAASGDKQSARAATEKLVAQLERAVHAAQHRAPNKLEEVMMAALTDSRRAKAVHWWLTPAAGDSSTRISASAAVTAHATSISSSSRDSVAVAAAVASDDFVAAAAAAAAAAARSLGAAAVTNDSVSGFATGSSVNSGKHVHMTDATAADTATTAASRSSTDGKVKRRSWWPTVPLENAPAPPPLILDVVPHTPQRRSYAATAHLRCTRDLAAVEAAVSTVMSWSPRVILDLIVPAGWGGDSGESPWCSLKSERASLEARKAALVAAASDTEQRYKMVTGKPFAIALLLRFYKQVYYNKCIR
jgi:hypothetical protein